MKEVPFYGNTRDGTHCYQAVLKMILKYYYPERDYTWDQLNKMTGKRDGLWTWPQRSYIAMRDLGFEVKIIDIFDYDEFIRDGLKYLEKEYGKEIAEGQERHCDIEYEIRNVRKFRPLIRGEKRVATIDDIIKLLADNFLVQCSINSSKLAGQDGYSSHSVLIIGYEGETLIVHDPGWPPKEYCRVKFDIFTRAWAYPNDKSKGIAAFKLNRTFHSFPQNPPA